MPVSDVGRTSWVAGYGVQKFKKVHPLDLRFGCWDVARLSNWHPKDRTNVRNWHILDIHRTDLCYVGGYLASGPAEGELHGFQGSNFWRDCGLPEIVVSSWPDPHWSGEKTGWRPIAHLDPLPGWWTFPCQLVCSLTRWSWHTFYHCWRSLASILNCWATSNRYHSFRSFLNC